MWLGQLSAIALVQIAVCAVLRLVWLARPDPFGSALVGKLDWYWFHAIALDSWQAFRVVAVAAVIGFIGGQRERLTRWLTRAVAITLGALTMLAVIDGEVMRFLGMHLSPSLTATYANAATVRELPALLAKDAGGPYVGAALLVLAPLALLWLTPRALARVHGWRPAAAFGALVAVGCLYAFVLWPGGFRQWRLAPPLDVIRTALTKSAEPVLEAAVQKRTSAAYAARWKPVGSQESFVLPDYPLFHATEHAACKLGFASAEACARDQDGDQSPVVKDCDDRNAAIHPGADDAPGDGVDRDCSGADRAPANVLLLVLETHRALNVGHLFPDPARPSATPNLDALASRGTTFTRALANGTPTVSAFMALHTSLLPHPTQTVASSFAHVRIHGLPQVLREHGYHTRFFAAADPAWDNQTAWLRRWYDVIDYDRSREQDGPLFSHVAEWFEREQPGAPGKEPYFVTVTTRTNHYPFHRVEGVETTGADTLEDRIADTMRYTDKHMGLMLERLAALPGWQNTVVIVTGDHGFPMGEHGYKRLHETAHVEATGVPIVLAGAHPKLAPLAGKAFSDAVSHIDIAPTVLDLAGIDPSGSFMGRSLLDLESPRDAIVITANEWSLSRGDKRLLVRSSPGEDGPSPPRWYDRIADPREQTPLAPAALGPAERTAEQELRAIPLWMADLYERDRLWPTAPGVPEPDSAHVSIQAP